MELQDQQDWVSSGAGFAVIAVKEFVMFVLQLPVTKTLLR
jgi:hypothetical protein